MRKRPIVRHVVRFVFITLPAMLVVVAFLFSVTAWVLSYRLDGSWSTWLPGGTFVTLESWAQPVLPFGTRGFIPGRTRSQLDVRIERGTLSWDYWSGPLDEWFETPSDTWEYLYAMEFGTPDIRFTSSDIVSGNVRLSHSTALLGAFAVVIIVRWYRSWRYRSRIRAGLCLACGYDLTGNTSGACPECGSVVRAANGTHSPNP